MMTPKDHMSQDLSYFSGPSTSGAANQRSVWVGPAFEHCDTPELLCGSCSPSQPFSPS